MNKREYKKLCDSVSTNKVFDPNKIPLMSDSDKNRLICYWVKNRMPIVVDFINTNTDISWLHCCGYFYNHSGKNFNFLCTVEQKYQYFK